MIEVKECVYEVCEVLGGEKMCYETMLERRRIEREVRGIREGCEWDLSGI